MQKTKGETKWLFNSTVKPTTRFLMISKSLRTFVVSILTTVEDSIHSMKQTYITTTVMFGEHLAIVTIENIKRKIRGTRTNECMVG